MTDQLAAACNAVEDAATLVASAVTAPRRTRPPTTVASRSRSSTTTRSLAYDLAHAASAVEGCRVMLRYARARRGRVDAGPRVHRRRAARPRGAARRARVGVGRRAQPTLAGDHAVRRRAPRRRSSSSRSPTSCAKHGTGPTHLSDDFELVAETFRRFADDKIRPGRRARAPHQRRRPRGRSSRASPSSAASGCRCPRSTAASPTGGESDYIGMVVATEELSRGSLGIGGSLVTRPEILTRALVAGGTEEQKQRWLPRIASGELMVGDHGDRARLRLRRRGREGHRRRRPTAAGSSTA